MRDICREARVTAPTVYYYFKSKEALFEAVQRETITMSGFIARLDEACAKAKEPKAQLQAFTRTYLSYFPKDRLNVGLYVRSSTELDSVGRKSLQTELIRLQRMLTKVVRRGVNAGAYRKTDPAMAAECLLGMMNRFVFQQIHFRRSYNPSEAAAYLSDFFFRAMKPTNGKKA
jgi:AcrR family transcriptional regulator